MADIPARTVIALATAIIFGACSPTSAEVGGQRPAATAQTSGAGAGSGHKVASEPTSETNFPARLLRNDRLVIGAETRICVATTVDPEARRIVESSGQRFDPDVAQGITRFTTSRLADEFRDRGWSRHRPRNRILAYIEHELNPQGCFDRPDTILVRHDLARGKSAQGYVIRLTATQGRLTYEIAVERPYAVKASDERRSFIDYRSNLDPWTRQPYWDPVRDSAKLSDSFIRHLLEETEK
jgi:hypothetical protein